MSKKARTSCFDPSDISTSMACAGGRAVAVGIKDIENMDKPPRNWCANLAGRVYVAMERARVAEETYVQEAPGARRKRVARAFSRM